MQDSDIDKLLTAKLSRLSERSYADSIAPAVQQQIDLAAVQRLRARRWRPWYISIASIAGLAISLLSLSGVDTSPVADRVLQLGSVVQVVVAADISIDASAFMTLLEGIAGTLKSAAGLALLLVLLLGWALAPER